MSRTARTRQQYTMHDGPIEKNEITAVILAGGKATRMGGDDKGLIPLRGRAMVEHVIERLQSQVGALLINANRNQPSYARYGFPVVSDESAGFQGPLAGIASAMRTAKTAYLLTAPCDSPLLPADLAGRLGMALVSAHADIAVAHDGARMQPVFALIKTSTFDSLQDYLRRGERKIDLWYEQHAFTTADFSDQADTFMNINSPRDLDRIEQRRASGS